MRCATCKSMKKLERTNCGIKKAIKIAEELKRIADTGEAAAGDNSCLLLYGVIRDCSYKIRGTAEMEMELHKSKGLWR